MDDKQALKLVQKKFPDAAIPQSIEYGNLYVFTVIYEYDGETFMDFQSVNKKTGKIEAFTLMYDDPIEFNRVTNAIGTKEIKCNIYS